MKSFTFLLFSSFVFYSCCNPNCDCKNSHNVISENKDVFVISNNSKRYYHSDIDCKFLNSSESYIVSIDSTLAVALDFYPCKNCVLKINPNPKVRNPLIEEF